MLTTLVRAELSEEEKRLCFSQRAGRNAQISFADTGAIAERETKNRQAQEENQSYSREDARAGSDCETEGERRRG